MRLPAAKGPEKPTGNQYPSLYREEQPAQIQAPMLASLPPVAANLNHGGNMPKGKAQKEHAPGKWEATYTQLGTP